MSSKAQNSEAYARNINDSLPLEKLLMEVITLISQRKKIHRIILIGDQWQLVKFDICSWYF